MVTCIIQARASSSRLPNKVLRPILGIPMLERQIERMRRATTLSRIVVATSTEASDDPIERLCDKLKIPYVRGPLDDVLGRFMKAAEVFPDTHYARSTADCPLIDPEVIDAVVAMHLKTQSDYTSNTMNPTFPDGLDFEVMTHAALVEAFTQAKLPSEREHVTPYIYNHPQKFRLKNVESQVDVCTLRWVVDEPQDAEFVELVYKNLYETNPNFSSQDIFELLNRKPELLAINQGLERNEGYKKSVEKDPQ